MVGGHEPRALRDVQHLEVDRAHSWRSRTEHHVQHVPRMSARALWFVVALAGCREPTASPVEAPSPTPSVTEPPRAAHGAGRDRYRGGGVYLDGQPIGMLRYAELPRSMEPMWETQRHRLPFKAGEPVRYRETRVPRYRITDYLKGIGVELAKVTALHLHGGRSAAIVIKGDDLRAHPDDILFKFAGNTQGKPIPQIRGVEVSTTFDDLSAMAIYVDRKPPVLTAEDTLELDGMPVVGIPYYGEPIRGGIRVYLDDRMVAVLKRNQMSTQAHHLPDVLRNAGVETANVQRMELINDEERTAELPWGPHDFVFNPAASGEIALDAKPATALALYTKRR